MARQPPRKSAPVPKEGRLDWAIGPAEGWIFPTEASLAAHLAAHGYTRDVLSPLQPPKWTKRGLEVVIDPEPKAEKKVTISQCKSVVAEQLAAAAEHCAAVSAEHSAKHIARYDRLVSDANRILDEEFAKRQSVQALLDSCEAARRSR